MEGLIIGLKPTTELGVELNFGSWVDRSIILVGSGRGGVSGAIGGPGGLELTTVISKIGERRIRCFRPPARRVITTHRFPVNTVTDLLVVPSPGLQPLEEDRSVIARLPQLEDTVCFRGDQTIHLLSL